MRRPPQRYQPESIDTDYIDGMSRRIYIRALFVAFATLLVAMALPATAHHGWSEYDTDRRLELTGTIKRSVYEQPHGYISLQTNDKLWEVVLPSPLRMQNRGLTEGMLKPGNRARVVGYPNRAKPDEMKAERITVDGKTVELR